MFTESFRYLQGIIAAHQGHTVQGRTRLQKTIRLLQRSGLPTDYEYTVFFYGPYSEALFFDLGLLESLGAVTQVPDMAGTDRPLRRIIAKDIHNVADVSGFMSKIRFLESGSLVVLELAATYDAYRELGHPHEIALQKLRRKKAEQYTEPDAQEALTLLRNLGLPAL